MWLHAALPPFSWCTMSDDLTSLIQTDAALAATEFASTVTYKGVAVTAVITPGADEFEFGEEGAGYVKSTELVALCQKDKFTEGAPVEKSSVVVSSTVAGVTGLKFHVVRLDEYAGMLQMNLKRNKQGGV